MNTSLQLGFFSSKEVNRNFKIKFYGTTKDGRKVNTLVGVRGMIAELGEQLAINYLVKAFNCPEDKMIRHPRNRGLKVTFYVH